VILVVASNGMFATVVSLVLRVESSASGLRRPPNLAV
jgi:hypothetical protein